MAEEKLPPIHPGEILLEEFLRPMGLSQYRVAKDINVSPRRINEIVHRKKIGWRDVWRKKCGYTRRRREVTLNPELVLTIRYGQIAKLGFY